MKEFFPKNSSAIALGIHSKIVPGISPGTHSQILNKKNPMIHLDSTMDCTSHKAFFKDSSTIFVSEVPSRFVLEIHPHIYSKISPLENPSEIPSQVYLWIPSEMFAMILFNGFY